MGAIAATFEMARQTLLQLLRHRLLWLLALAMLGIPALVLAMAAAGQLPREINAQRVFVFVASMLHLSVLLPWTAVFFGVQAVHGDIEDRTFQYLFLRPVPRPALLLGKWLAAALLTALASLAGLLLLLAAVQATGIAFAPQPTAAELTLQFAGAMLLGAAAYTAVAVLLAARFRWPMVWGAAYVVGLEYFLAVLPPEAGVRSLAVLDALRRQLCGSLDLSGRELRVLWPNSVWRDEYFGHPQRQLLWTVGVCLLLAVWIYRRSEYDSRPRE